MLALLNSPAEIIAVLLIDAGLGSDPVSWANGIGSAWPIFVSNEPSSPDDCITLYDTQGTESGRSHVDGDLLSHYGIQVKIRGIDFPTGNAKAQYLRQQLANNGQLLRATVGIVPASYYVPAIVGIGQVLDLGSDTPNSKRRLFTINCKSAIRRLV